MDEIMLEQNSSQIFGSTKYLCKCMKLSNWKIASFATYQFKLHNTFRKECKTDVMFNASIDTFVSVFPIVFDNITQRKKKQDILFTIK